MEPWEQSIVKVNFVNLLKATRCNVEFVSILEQAKLLSQDDLEDLESIPLANQLQRSRKLYSILLTRKGAFTVLREALTQTCQSGAVAILQKPECLLRSYGLISVNKNHVLGKGKTGKVYLGKFDNRDVAVKIIRDDEEQAIKEVNFLKKLDVHPNIVRYLIAEPSDDQVYIALELCQINLHEEIINPVFNLEPVAVLRQCTDAVAFLHDREVLHGDLKPPNIMLNYLGIVKLSDFGFARQLESGMSAASISGVVGTADWLAPEILKQALTENVSEKRSFMSKQSDIFSLGCVFYFVLTKGQHPFGPPHERLFRICNNSPQISTVALPGNEWKELVEKLISVTPSSRLSAKSLQESNCLAVPKKVPSTKLKTVKIEPEQEKCERNLGLISANSNSSFEYSGKSVENEDNLGNAEHISELGVTKGRQVFFLKKAILSQNVAKKVVKPKINGDGRPGIKDLEEKIIADLNLSLTEKTKILKSNNAITRNKDILLHIAVRAGKSGDYLAQLIELGADRRAKSSDGYPILHVAAEVGNYDAIKYLVSLGEDVNESPFQYNERRVLPIHRTVLCKTGFLESVELLVELGTNINEFFFDDYYGLCTILTLAVRNKRPVEDILGILKLGASEKANTRLAIFAVSSDMETFDMMHQMFLTSGFKINDKFYNGFTLLHYAASEGSKEIVDKIITLGGNWKQTDDFYNNMLHHAAESGNEGTLKYFLAKGLDVNSVNQWGQTPLHVLPILEYGTIAKLRKKRCSNCLKILFEYNADTRIKDNKGRTYDSDNNPGKVLFRSGGSKLIPLF